ncbi:hypothetical protein TrLO_g11841 [Triparma laevis f. longispina]|uniref:Uncharacterized protein n=1 Tax=Triparma laevis f. longispina TaxID=1714387 RepID=A0A9W7KYR3_9STRA|nr:hypothetical protein TrLO_g11841 [Triparma laevis f. longispina]
MTTFTLLVSASATLALAYGTPCTPVTTPDSNWAFDNTPTQHPSCTSSGGGVNDLGSAPTQCEGDIASVYTKIDPTNGAECLSAHASTCKIPMRNFTSLDYDFSVDSCNGIWAAPLWMTPDTWQWGGGSGEIDSLELCPRSSISMNFAGGGSQVELDSSTFSIDFTDNAHVTVRKDPSGIITITTCKQSDLTTNSQCPAPTYSSCDDCLYNNNKEFACWCDNQENIYSSGGCTDGTDCIWTLVSDVWNGVSGDEGYTGCMTEVPEIGLAAGKPNMDTKCAVSVEKITLRGDNGGPLMFASGSPASCSALTTTN